MREILVLSLSLSLILTLIVACEKEKQKAVPQQAQKVQPATPPLKVEPAPQKPEDKKVETEAYSYSPQGRRDPFLSIIEASKKEREAEKKKKSLKPSEMYDVAEIKVIAIARDKNRSYAMVQLPDKKYFTVKEGMTLGIYNGKVIRIDTGSVVVREYIKDYKGEIQPKDTILKLRKEEGE
ncbi:MAG TPA: pilus assembly protein PilP [Thermodesulfovibrionales bacterium]|nr:pilus assembly protein PilP [Thermodesulfovibrionales bacterium]